MWLKIKDKLIHLFNKALFLALLNKSFYGSRYGFLDGQKRVKNREMSKMWLKIKDKLIHLFNKAINN